MHALRAHAHACLRMQCCHFRPIPNAPPSTPIASMEDDSNCTRSSGATYEFRSSSDPANDHVRLNRERRALTNTGNRGPSLPAFSRGLVQVMIASCSGLVGFAPSWICSYSTLSIRSSRPMRFSRNTDGAKLRQLLVHTEPGASKFSSPHLLPSPLRIRLAQPCSS